ncbi:tetratricopeptide repeat protein [Desulfolutivibrio sp.]|uniref:tetratricopeptide repeat protein n=1 Tax=Desulfolutivibrio sp. TaxID=2773296 RepID=UPI002F96B823
MYSFLLRFLLIFLIFLSQSCSQDNDIESKIINSARTAYLTGENITSEEFYKNYLQQFPKGKYRLEAWERIYDITINLRKDKINALPLLEAMLLEFANEKQLYPSLLKKTAVLQSDLNNNELSIQLWNKYIGLVEITDIEKNEARIQLSKQYLFCNNFDLALKSLRDCNKTIDLDGVFSLCQLQEAQVLFRLNEFDAASALLLNLRNSFRKNSDIYLESSFLLGDIYELKHDRPAAIKIFESIVDSYPNTLAVKTRIDNLKRN